VTHAGDLLAEMLVGYGTTHVFGLPGGQTAALYAGPPESSTFWSATSALRHTRPTHSRGSRDDPACAT
jgi:hypothetical protein